MSLIKGFFEKIFEHKEIFIASLGWVFALVEFIINRNILLKDKKQERKHQAYSGYMRKVDEIMNNMRNDPNKLLDIGSEFFKHLINNMGDEKIISKYLIKYNEQIIEFVKKSTEPLLILRQELNEMKLICSTELLEKIEGMNKLITDYNNAVQESLAKISHADTNSLVNILQPLSQDERWYKLEQLNNEILYIMRKEIGD
jgi:hypothetical protein